MTKRHPGFGGRSELALWFACTVVLALATVYVQVMALEFRYIEQGNQILRHRAVLDGTSGNPWQYRILSEYMVEGVIRALTRAGIHRPVLLGFIGFRVAQNVFLFLLEAYYFRRLQITVPLTLLGLSALAWSTTQMLYDSDLSLNLYGDAIACVAAALLVLAERWAWTVPLVAVSALNRETSAIIPLLVLAGALVTPAAGDRRRGYIAAAAGFGMFALVYGLVRYGYGPRPPVAGFGWQDFVNYSVRNPHTGARLLTTFMLLPVAAALTFRSWPRILKGFFWAVLPLWCAVHVYSAHFAETRLFLVPLLVIVLPGVLCGVQAATSQLTFNEDVARNDCQLVPCRGAEKPSRIASLFSITTTNG